MPTLSHAIVVAAEAHSLQIDKIGDSYIHHPLRVMERVRNAYIPDGLNREKAMMIAVLHDTLEDTSLTAEDLSKEGFPPEVVYAVQLLTKMEKEPYLEFVKRAQHYPYSRLVKYHDIMDNSDPVRLFLLDEETRNRLIKKYNAAKALF